MTRLGGTTVTHVADGFKSAGQRNVANADPATPETADVAIRHRDESLRALYAESALSQIPRLLGSIDRNPYRATYGCMDRQFWHYRTADFPSEMYQEGALALAQVYRFELPGNRWQGEPRVRELAIAAMRYAASSCHRDGSCDDYYPYERALGAAVFSLQATTRAYQLLELDDPQIAAWFQRRAQWLIDSDESGRLSNHQALAALALFRVFEITGDLQYQQAAEHRIRKLLSWQSDEGWFEEYGGADPGYQTVTIDCLAKYQQASGVAWFDDALARAVKFAHAFLHPDGSYGGPYGSRGTMHFYPHGFELLAGTSSTAAAMADGFLRSLQSGTVACFDDDRLLAHRLGNLIEAYLDWQKEVPATHRASCAVPTIEHFPQAGLLVRREALTHTVVSTARGGVFKHFAEGEHIATDAGLILETDDGHVAVSQMHDLKRDVHCDTVANGQTITVRGELSWTRFETATPLKFIVLRTFMLLVGRWCRTVVRKLLQRRLITGRRPCPIRLTRSLELNVKPSASLNRMAENNNDNQPVALRVIDTIELLDRKTHVLRMSFGTDHEAAYVAATGVYQPSVLSPWQGLDAHVDALNRDRIVQIVREFP